MNALPKPQTKMGREKAAPSACYKRSRKRDQGLLALL